MLEQAQIKTSSTITARAPDKWLHRSTIFWFTSILAGQWIFFLFIIAFYLYSVVSGNLEIWNRFEPFGSTPFKPEDTMGNFAFASHAIGAGIIAFAGVFQLMPQVRNRFPRFHKYTGYVYLTTVLALALSGFYLVWIRGTSPNMHSAIGTTINGILIIVFAFLTVHYARKRDIAVHRKWALRLFLVSNAQWFLRVGMMSYFIVANVLDVPSSFFPVFSLTWTFGCFLLPLMMLQLYFYAKENNRAVIKYIANGALVLLTLLMLIGIIGFTPILHKLSIGAPIVF